MPEEKLYSDLSWIWPIMSPPEDYIEEARFIAAMLSESADLPGRELLNLGCGGGPVDKTLKKYFKITGVDKSEYMLELARKLNPEATYVTGDMRTARLGRQFDFVITHDAISYMLTKADLRAVFETAYAHLKPGGIYLTVVEETPDRFKQDRTWHYTRTNGEIYVTSVEYFHDPNPNDTAYGLVFIYFIRKDGQLQVEVDRHECGIFPMETWQRLLKEVGFVDTRMDKYKEVIPDDSSYDPEFRVLISFKPKKD
jgi:SAM-dependent methyltransferase